MADDLEHLLCLHLCFHAGTLHRLQVYFSTDTGATRRRQPHCTCTSWTCQTKPALWDFSEKRTQLHRSFILPAAAHLVAIWVVEQQRAPHGPADIWPPGRWVELHRDVQRAQRSLRRPAAHRPPVSQEKEPPGPDPSLKEAAPLRMRDLQLRCLAGLRESFQADFLMTQEVIRLQLSSR